MLVKKKREQKRIACVLHYMTSLVDKCRKIV